MGRSYVVSALALVLVWTLAAERAYAQDVPTTLQPRGPASGPAPTPAPTPAPAPAPAPQPVIIPVPEGGLPPAAAEEDTGFFYVPDELRDGINAQQTFIASRPPLFHVVRGGDTLWDICFLYFNNPWEWPKVWSYNPDITNPHWIYPGDRVRLYPEGGGIAIDIGGPGEPIPDAPDNPDQVRITPNPVQPPLNRVRLRNFSLLDEADRLRAFTVTGSVEEKTLLAEGDSIYLSYSANNPPELGQEYTIYRETETLRHPTNLRTVGRYVRILGALRVTSVEEGKNARAYITDSVDVIERGARVAQLPREFGSVRPKQTSAKIEEGTVVAILGEEQLIGQNQVVFIDKGSDDGLELGDVLYVFRRGDAYRGKPVDGETIGQNDRSFPERGVGELMMVQVGKRLSAAFVNLAVQEIGIGDRVISRPVQLLKESVE